MTLLVAWAAVDTHGTSSMYIASDSRISWGNEATYDRGRKVFAFQKYPDILGYCGDVLFPSLALNQIVDLADAGLLFGSNFDANDKFQAIVDKLNDLAREYPCLHTGLEENSLSVIHGSRHASTGDSFSCRTISWSKKRGWSGETAPMPRQSDVLFALGSGADTFSENLKRYKQGPTAGTSRAVFHCICDTLANTDEPTIGGPPQLVGIIRKPGSGALTYGTIHRGRRTFLGAHIDNLRNFDAVQWRNENFELCDGRTGRKLSNAQPQPDPNRR
jgi:hypothetical protein